MFAGLLLSLTSAAQVLPDNWTGDTGVDTYQESTNIHGGTYSCKVDVNTGNQASTDMRHDEVSVTAGDSYTYSFWVWTSANVKVRVVLEWNGAGITYGGYSNAGTSGFEQVVATGTVPTGAIGVKVGVRFYDQTGFVAPETQYIDDFSFESPTGTPITLANGGMENWPGGSTPAITVSPASLSGFTYVEGSGPSGEQTFTVSGSNLTADILLTAPTDYEISETTGSGFTGTITLTQSGGSVGTTTIYTRLKAGLLAGNYNNEDITATSTGATTQTVTCSGSVTSSGGSCATELIISQVVESGVEKYLEIANFTGASVSLVDYDVVIYSNGSTTVTSTIDLTDASSIADQDVWVVANTSSSAWSGTPDQTSGSLSFNGNDVIALRKTSSNIDVFGTIGDATYFYNDQDVIRNAAVTSPTTTYNSSDWTFTAYAGTDPADLGQHTMNCSGTAPADPAAFTATAASTTQVDLSWTQNGNSDAVMVVFNTTAITATPVDGTTYTVGSTFSDGSEVIYNQSGTSYSHTSLVSNTTYYYKAWSVDGSVNYSSGVIDNATTLKNEPSNHVTGFTAGTPTSTTIPLTWSDNDGTVAADSFLIRANITGTFTAPTDGIAEADDTDMSDDVGQVNVTHGAQAYTWTGLKTSTTYHFAIYPYTNSGTDIDYKTDGTVPTTSATTAATNKKLIITEVADPGDNANARFVEIYNAGTTTVDFSTDTWYLSRQANGSTWNDVQLTGTLAAGAVFVVAYGADFTNFNTAYGFDPDMASGFISGNGDDGYYLYFGSDHTTGELIDAYGVIDIDGTGKAWEYTDSKAVRKRDVIVPVTSWDSTQWVITVANVQDMTPSACREDVTWQGTSSTDFNEVGTNWNGTHGFVPDASYNVTVPNVTNKPVVTRLSVVNTLTVQSASSLEVSATGSLTVLK